MNPIILTTNSLLDGALMMTGVPFAGGRLPRGSGLRLLWGSRELPLWWKETGYWPDGSVKWIFLHANVPEGKQTLSLEASDSLAKPPGFPGGIVFRGGENPGGWTLSCGSVSLDIGGEGWTFRTPNGAWRMDRQWTDTDLTAPDDADYALEWVEESPLAPLVRWRPRRRGDGLLTDHVFRLDPAGERLIWQRRMTWHSEGRYALRHAGVLLKPEAKLTDTGSLLILGPGAAAATGSAEKTFDTTGSSDTANSSDTAGSADGGIYPEGRFDAERHSVWVEKAWQRSPFGIDWDASGVAVHLYPAEARPLGVAGGTSYRHTLHLSCGTGAAANAGHRVEVVVDPAHVCASQALGPIGTSAQIRQLLPGLQMSYRASLDNGRYPFRQPDAPGRKPDASGRQAPPQPQEQAALAEETKQDAKYFGLQHYGDWPLPWGSYVLKGRFMYADNEYDVAYAYFLGYAIYGDPLYRHVAEQCAVHMTDVDWISTTGDMRFHGYAATAEDHEYARPATGEHGHYWTDGYWLQYFFNGDPWARESAEAVIAFLIGQFRAGGEPLMRRTWATAERNLGWPLVAIVAGYEATGSAAMLEGIRDIVSYIKKFTDDPDREIEEETGTEDMPVVWWRTALQDGCKPLMLGVILEGLERYHRMSGDADAASALVTICNFLIERTWETHMACFRGEYNAVGSFHRYDGAGAVFTPLFIRGLGYAYDITGNESFREASEKALHGCLWIMYNPGFGGKSIGMFGRMMGSYAGMLIGWQERDEARYRASVNASDGEAWSWRGGLPALLASGEFELTKGQPAFAGNVLIAGPEQYMAGRLERSLNADAGEALLRINWLPGSSSRPGQRCYLHLCDDVHNRSCISVVSFYTRLYVRVYDSNRRLIQVAEADLRATDVNGNPVVPPPAHPMWEEDSWHTVRVQWRAPGELVLTLDGIEADRRVLDRPLGGRFTRLHVGHKPGNWQAKSQIELLALSMETSIQGGEPS